MRIRWQPQGPDVTFELEPSEADRPLLEGRERFHVELPATVDLTATHPDLVGLALLLVTRTSTADAIELPVAVSPGFAEQVHRLAGRELSPVDDQLTPRQPPVDGVPGLAFSGGVDSVAALSVLPEATRSYFLERRTPEGAEVRLLSPAAGLAACEGVRAAGREVRVVPTDLEYVREPPGFPEHYANAVPLLLCADHDRLRTVGWGLVAESAYRFGRTRFIPYLERIYNRRWTGLFAAAGLPMLNPVMGVSEVGTTRIALDSPFGHLAQSCVRGPLGAPCGRCVKCFRKRLIVAAHEGRWPSDAELDAVLAAYAVRAYLSTAPIKQPLGLGWAVARYPGNHPVLRMLARRLEVEDDDLGFAGRWYDPAAAFWPEPDRGPVAQALDGYLGRMSPQDRDRLEAWDVTGREESDLAIRLGAALGALLDAEAGRVEAGRVKPVAYASSAAAERAREEQYRARERALTERVRSLQRAVERLERRVEELETSTSYRVGHALVRVARPLQRRRGR